MKAYTDLPQSKKLAEILSNETSDMYYWCGESIRFGGYKAQNKDYDIPCWSLAALLSIIPQPSLEEYEGRWRCESFIKEKNLRVFGKVADTHIDACINVILSLKERNLI